MWLWKRKSPTDLIRRGDRYFRLKAYRLAIASYTRALRRAPDEHPWAYANRARAYLRAGDLEEALQDLDTAIRLDPRCGDFYFRRGNAYAHAGDNVRALDDYDRAIRLSPRHIDAYIARGLLHMRLGDDDRALDDFNRAVDLDPTRAESYMSRARYWLQLNAYERAWADVARCRDAGGHPEPGFLRALRRQSGRNE